MLPAMADASRSPAIMADAAHAILTRPSREATGRFFIDEDVLRAQGQTDFSMYAPSSGAAPALDVFVPDDIAARYSR